MPDSALADTHDLPDPGPPAKKNALKKIQNTFVIDSNLTAPIAKGENVGYVMMKINNEVVTKINLYSLEDIKLGSAYRRTLDSILKKF